LRVLSRTNLAYPSIQPLCNQLLPHSFSQRRLPNPSTFSALRTLLSLTANSFFQSSSICLMIPDTAYISSRINTCKSVSKQTTLTTFRINTCEKHRGRGVPLQTASLESPGNPRRMRHVAPLSPAHRLACAYFPSTRGCIPLRPSDFSASALFCASAPLWQTRFRSSLWTFPAPQLPTTHYSLSSSRRARKRPSPVRQTTQNKWFPANSHSADAPPPPAA